MKTILENLRKRQPINSINISLLLLDRGSEDSKGEEAIRELIKATEEFFRHMKDELAAVEQDENPKPV